MTYVVADRVKETTTSTGTGNITLAGAVTGFKTFSSTIGTGNTTTYVIVNSTGSEWEVGLGTLSGTTTLARTKVFSNSLGTTAAVNFSAGTKNVFVSMAAAMNDSNVVFGTQLVVAPNTYGFVTAVGAGATASNNSVTVVGFNAAATGDTSTAIGSGANAPGYYSTAVGTGAYSNGSQGVALGSSAQLNGTGAVAVGSSANAGYDNSIAVGPNATASNPEAIAIGHNAGAGSGATVGIAIGSGTYAYGNSIAIGESSSGIGDNIVIGHGLNAPQTGATYMNKFRTGVTPTGTSWFLKWDDSTKEVYADPGTPAGANWYSIQDNIASYSALNQNIPTGTATTSNPGSDIWWFSNAATSPSGWSFNGTMWGGYNVYQTSAYPVSSPLSGASFSGLAICYYAGYAEDSGKTSTYQAYTGTGAYSNYGTFFSGMAFSLSGTAQVGHAIIYMNTSAVGTFTPGGGVTLLEEIYDSTTNWTYWFVDLDASAVSNVSSGSPIGYTSSGAASYYVNLWYNY